MFIRLNTVDDTGRQGMPITVNTDHISHIWPAVRLGPSAPDRTVLVMSGGYGRGHFTIDLSYDTLSTMLETESTR